MTLLARAFRRLRARAAAMERLSHDAARRLIDLSIYLENDVLSDPPPLAPKITYQTHADTLPEFLAMLPGTTAEDYPDGEAAAAERVTLTTHNGTHLDAPWHYHSTQDAKNGGPRPSLTIDQVPLEWCLRPGVKLDFRHFPMATSPPLRTSRPS